MKRNAKTKMYRDYKNFKIELFKKDLRENLENHTNYDYRQLDQTNLVLKLIE